MYLINTFLGFLGAQIFDILKGVKTSETTPVKFDVVFFLKDTWQKIVLSLALSVILSIALHLNFQDALKVFNTEIEAVNNLVYLLIGAMPEFVLQLIRKKTGFTTPKETEGYNRK